MPSASKNIYCTAYPSQPYTIYVSFSESDASVAKNTSKISISGYLTSQHVSWSSNYNSYLRLYWHDNRTNKDTLVAETSGFKSFSAGTKKTVSGSITVTHKDDGSLSGYAKLSYVAGSTSGGWAPSSNSVQTSNTKLTTIARASSISSVSGSYLGSAVKVSISRKSSSFTHKVEYSFAGSSYTTVTSSATTSASFTPPLSLATNIPNTTSGSLTVRVTTYNGSTKVGSSVTKSITLSLPSSVAPTMGTPSVTRVDNGVPSSWGVYVKGFSKATVSIVSAAGIYGSTIKSYLISGGGLSSASSSATTGVLNSAGTYTFTCKITDSRGRSVTKTVSITVIDYSSPSLSVTAERCTSAGTVSSSGTYLKVVVDYSFASVSSKNSITSKKCTCNGVSNTSFADNTAFILNAKCTANTSYVLTASVTDALGKSASASIDIPTDVRVMNVKANKKGIAFGKFAEDDDTLELAWDLKLKSGNICLDYDIINNF